MDVASMIVEASAVRSLNPVIRSVLKKNNSPRVENMRLMSRPYQ